MLNGRCRERPRHYPTHACLAGVPLPGCADARSPTVVDVQILPLARSVVDPSAHRRSDPALLSRAAREPATWVVLLRDGRIATVVEGGGVALDLRRPADLAGWPEDTATDGALWLFLGEHAGETFLALLVTDLDLGGADLEGVHERPTEDQVGDQQRKERLAGMLAQEQPQRATGGGVLRPSGQVRRPPQVQRDAVALADGGDPAVMQQDDPGGGLAGGAGQQRGIGPAVRRGGNHRARQRQDLHVHHRRGARVGTPRQRHPPETRVGWVMPGPLPTPTVERVTRTPLALAALATVAVPGLDAVDVRRPRHPTSGTDAAVVIDAEGRRWVVRAPQSPAAGAALEAEVGLLERLVVEVDAGRLPFDVPRPAGFVDLPEGGRAVVHPQLPGRPLHLEDLGPGPGLAAAVGRAIAAVHELSPETVEDAGLPVYEADAYRARRLAEVDEAARTGRVPTGLLRRWERALEDVAVWRFRPTVVHGDLSADHMLCSADRPVGVQGWSEAKVADPADDLAWLLVAAPHEGVDAILEAYNMRRSELRDPHLTDRALLAGELALARWLLHGVRLEDEAIVEDATAMLVELAEHTAEPAPAVTVGGWLHTEEAAVEEEPAAEEPAAEEPAVEEEPVPDDQSLPDDEAGEPAEPDAFPLAAAVSWEPGASLWEPVPDAETADPETADPETTAGETADKTADEPPAQPV